MTDYRTRQHCCRESFRHLVTLDTLSLLLEFNESPDAR